MKAALLKKNFFRYAFLMGSLLFLLGILWVNFHGGPWYDYDMYADLRVSELMAQQRSLFPEGWIFGNQYYVIATPVVAALFQSLGFGSLLSMSFASCLMTAIIVFSFLWCCKPFLSRRALATGLFCLVGAVIVADSAASNTFGLQVFYTMASYYACYLWGILFHLGIYLRLRQGQKPPVFFVLIVLLSDLAFGMQSLRETLILNLPLLLLDLLCLWRLGKNLRSSGFVLLSLVANIAGTRLICLFPVQSAPIIEPVRFSLSPSTLSTRLSACLQALFEISGLRYFHAEGARRLLFFLALFYILLVAAAVILLVHRRDHSPAAHLLVFCLLSLLCVCGVGIFLFHTRAIYYFVWFLLASLCPAYLSDMLPEGCGKKLVLTGLLLAGMVSFVFHFGPDMRKYPRYEAFYTQLSESLAEEGVDTLYLDFLTHPMLAACSGGRLRAGTVKYNFDDPAHPFCPYPHLRETDFFTHPDPEHARIVLSRSSFGGVSSLDYIRENASPAYQAALEDMLIPVRTESLDYMTLVFYRFKDPSVIVP